MAAHGGVENGGTGCGGGESGVAVIAGKGDALNALEANRGLSHESQPRREDSSATVMSGGSDARLVVARISCVSCICDVIIILALGLVILFMSLFAQPYARGFYCDDDSIRYPYHPDTVSNAALISFSVCIPFLTVMVCEAVATKREGASGRARRVALSSCVIPVYCSRICWSLLLFVFGLGVEQVVVDTGKFTMGRLRPHFLAACDPTPSVAELCQNRSHVYITDFTCNGDETIVREARLSFPSGHSSMSFYAAVFTVLFLWRRFEWRRHVRIQLAFLQLVFLLLAWLTALTRITDHKHHWSDVLVGCCIGSIVAIVSVVTALSRYPIKIDAVPDNASTYTFGSPAPHAVIVENTPPPTV